VSAAIEGVLPEQLPVFAVWIPMLPGDSHGAAEASSSILAGHVTAQFYDAHRRVGRAVASSLGACGQIAWDMYLTYARNASWPGDVPPRPPAYAHQLPGSWADSARCFVAAALLPELRVMVSAVVSGR